MEPAQGQAQDHQEGQAPGQDVPRAGVDPLCQGREDAVVAGDVTEPTLEGAQPRDALEDRGAHHPAAEDDQDGGHQGQGRRHGQQDHRQAGQADVVQDRGPHDQQPQHGDGHGQGGEEDGAPGGPQGRGHAVHNDRVASPRPLPAPLAPGRHLGLRVGPGQLLPVAGGNEQAVVDGQSQADDADDIDHEGLQVRPQAERPQDPQGRGDRGQGPDQGHPRRQEAAEDQHHDQQGQRQGDGLAVQEVTLHLVVDGRVRQPVVRDNARRPRVHVGEAVGYLGQAGLHPGDEGVTLLDVVLVAPVLPGQHGGAVGVHGHDHEEAVQVLGCQHLGGRLRQAPGDHEGIQDVPVADHGAQVLVGVGQSGAHRLPLGGGGDVHPGNEQVHRRAVTRQGVQDLLPLGALRALHGGVAGAQALEQVPAAQPRAG